jgi:WD40 repeat protein/serine/threonine protein kinase
MPLDPHFDVIKTAVVAGQGSPAARARDLVAPPARTPTPLEPIADHTPPHNHVPPHVGSTIKHYELLRKLGEGGMGAVYLARDNMLGRLVAIKVLQMHAGPSAERFLIEAQATARCRHDNIVVIHEVDQLHGYLYMVLEYLEGRTLREWMAQRERFAGAEPPAEPDPSPGIVSPSLAVELMLPVVRALACAHQLGIVHRDLKPENVFLTEAGRVVVLDFGIAKRLGANDLSALNAAARPLEPGARVTQEGALLGTLPYMSPEQLRSEDIDARSDLWAVGMLFYELVTGVHPLSHCSTLEILDIGDSEEPMPGVRDKRPDVGPLGAVIDRCLHKPRDSRYPSAEELLAALEALALGGKASELGEDESPFAGLSAFQEADAERYVGREREVSGLTGRLRNQPLLVVAGPSGTGKSSFVRAGVIPALKRSGEPWEALILRPGRRPLAALADVLAQVAPVTGADVPASVLPASASEVLLGAFHTQPGLVGARLRARCRQAGGGHRILLFVDQFEELYTLGADAAERAAFVACLEGVADDASSSLRVILSLRSDFLYRMAEEDHFLAEATRGLVFLRPMGHDGLRDALTRPLEASGYRFENEAMIEAMLGGLERTKSPLPLLQFTAMRLWDARDRASRRLTQASYDLSGGVAGALSAHANAVLSSLSSDDQRLCRAVLLQLCTPERTRAVVSLSELHAHAADSGAVEQVIRRLADARLVVVEAGGEREGTTVELCHESLIESWDKLQQWLAESEQDAQFVARLHVAAQQWGTSEEAEGLLWRDRAAREASEWLSRRRADQGAGESLGLGMREERFLVAVVALSERVRRRRQRIVAGVLATVCTVATVVFILSIGVKRQAARADRAAVRAEQEALSANVEARQARNATRMAAARELEQKDPTAMLALLREVEPPGVPPGWAQLASKALQSGLAREVRPWGMTAYTAAWSPDGQRIVAALHDGTARVWKAGDSAEPIVLRGHEGLVMGAAFSPDGAHIVTASEDKTARVWMADGSGQPFVLRGHELFVWRAAFSPDGTRIVTASDDKTARVWNADGTGQPVILRAHEDGVASAAFSSDGQRIVTASLDKTARVWKVDGSGLPVVLRGHEGIVFSAAFSPDGQHIVTGSDDKTVRVWNADGSGEPLVLRGHEGQVHCVVFSPDGKRILTASYDKTVRVWNADGRDEPLVLRGHEHIVYSAAWSPDGASIVTASHDQTTRVFRIDLLSASAPILLRGHELYIQTVAFSADSQRIVTGSRDKTARVWRADGSGPPVVLRGHEGPLGMVAFSRDDQRVVTASDQTARVWRANGSGQSVVLRGHEGQVYTAELSPDNQRIVTGSSDKTARVWRADGSGQPVVLRGHEQTVWWAGFSPEGKHIATVSDDPIVRVWSSDGSEETYVYRDYNREIKVVAWSPDGTRILIGGLDNTVRVLSITRSETPVVLRGHDQKVVWAAWSPDGKRIVTASDDATARVWNADGSGEPVVLRGHARGLLLAAFSPDGSRIFTTSPDQTVRVWNVDGSGEPYVLSLSEGQTLLLAALSPDGTHIVTGVLDKIARVWPLGAPFRGADDPRLWTATPYCLSIERRIALLSVSEARARADQDACERRVKAASIAATRPSSGGE